MLSFPGIPQATEVPAGSTSAPSTTTSAPAGGGGFSAALAAVQNLPGFGLAFQAASSGLLGGPVGMMSAAAFSALTGAVQAAGATTTPQSSPATATAAPAATSPGPSAAAPPNSVASGSPWATAVAGGPATATSDQVTGNLDLGLRSFAALAAYDRTSGHTAPAGRILA